MLFTWISKPFAGQPFSTNSVRMKTPPFELVARHDVDLELEVAERMIHERAVVERVPLHPHGLGDDGAVFDGEGRRDWRASSR